MGPNYLLSFYVKKHHINAPTEIGFFKKAQHTSTQQVLVVKRNTPRHKEDQVSA